MYILEISDFLEDYYDGMTEEKQNSNYGKLLREAYYDRLREETKEQEKRFNEALKDIKID